MRDTNTFKYFLLQAVVFYDVNVKLTNVFFKHALLHSVSVHNSVSMTFFFSFFFASLDGKNSSFVIYD